MKKIFSFLNLVVILNSCSKLESQNQIVTGFNSDGAKVTGEMAGPQDFCPTATSKLSLACQDGDYKLIFLKDCTELCSQPVQIPR